MRDDVDIAALEQAAEQEIRDGLTAWRRLEKETHPAIRQDIELTIAATKRHIKGNDLSHNYEIPYYNMVETVFHGLRALLDDQVEFNQIYFYQIEAVSLTGQRERFGPVQIRVVPPYTFSLAQNIPNPINPTTAINYQLPQAVRVHLSIFNLLGQEIVVLVDEMQPAGYHQVVWDGRSKHGQPVASGVYFYRLQADTFQRAKKMLLLK